MHCIQDIMFKEVKEMGILSTKPLDWSRLKTLSKN